MVPLLSRYWTMPRGYPNNPRPKKKATAKDKAEALGMTLHSFNYRKYQKGDRPDFGSPELAEKKHREMCVICKADAAQPGIEGMVHDLYNRYFTAGDIEEQFGYYTTTVVRKRYNKKGDEIIESVPVEKPNVSKKAVWTHARFFNWQQQRSANVGAIVDTIIDAGMNNLIQRASISEKALMRAIDVKNKMEGNYYKPMKNPKDVRAQMEATVQTILNKHLAAGETDVTREDVIASLEVRPGFTHIRRVLEGEKK